jgi:hypothetical protein
MPHQHQLMASVATVTADAVYAFGGVRDLPYFKDEQWYGEYGVTVQYLIVMTKCVHRSHCVED